ncbi:MAG: glycine oxidase, partial [Paenibacillus sp.]|nr:glycine oxidase [Paenibacillus sp.]
CAFEAAMRGYKVTLAEPGKLGGQASGAAAGMLAPFSENGEQPDDFFRLCLESLKLFPEWMASVEEHSGMSAEYMSTGSLHILQHEADLLPAEGRIRWQNEWGARAELVGASQLGRLEPALAKAAVGAVYSPAESHVYAPKLVEALAAACKRLGVALIDHAGPVVSLRRSDGGSKVGLGTWAYELFADRLVLCPGAWSNMYEEWLGLKLPVHPIRGQICSFQSPAANYLDGYLRHMVFSSQAYWVVKRNGSIVCGASEDVAGYQTAVTERGISRLRRATDRWLPALGGATPVHSWAGLRPATPDGMPLIGEVAGNGEWLMAAGHYRNGILLSPVTAKLVADRLDGRAHVGAAPFAPGRFTSR